MDVGKRCSSRTFTRIRADVRIHEGSRHAGGAPHGLWRGNHGPSGQSLSLQHTLQANGIGRSYGPEMPPRSPTGKADLGTLFLDEIADMPIDVQPKLLRLAHARSHAQSTGYRRLRALIAPRRELRQSPAPLATQDRRRLDARVRPHRSRFICWFKHSPRNLLSKLST
jgi:hypothetical protein